jgi:serine/threonine-protein kinase
LSEDFAVRLAGFRAGSLVAGYRLEAQVGTGGTAVVFQARDERLGRLVALKILDPALAEDGEFRRRFIAESRAAALVDDPHIIPVYEAGEAEGVLFIAMRFVKGGDLRGVLHREGALTPGRVAAFISPVASALDAAHAAGLVHRDVKPANILVDAGADRPDHVYLSDFGVSKGAMSSVATGTGQFLGTPDYSAPEQIQGLAVDGRADQYALACLAYELLTGAVPFERHEGLAVIYAHLSEPPPSLGSRRPGLPGAADQVLARGLAKAPEKRYGSCWDFADALRQALGLAPEQAAAAGSDAAMTRAVSRPTEKPGTAGGADTRTARQRVQADAGSGSDGVQPTRRPRRRGVSRAFSMTVWLRQHRVLAVAMACAVLAGAGVVPFVLASSPSSPSYSRVATLAEASAGHGAIESTAFSRSGTTLATADSNGRTYLWNVATQTLAGTLTDPSSAGVTSVAFSRDGTTLATADSNGSTYLWNVATKTLTATLPGSSSGGLNSVAFSPDGTTLATADSNGSTYLWNNATKTLTATLPDPTSGAVNSVAFSPSGAALATADSNGSTYLWNLANQVLTGTLTDPSNLGVNSVAFSPDGTAVATADGNGSTYLWNVAAKTLAGTLPGSGSGAVNSVAFSPDGTAVATADGNGSTYLWNVAAKTLAGTLPGSGSGAVNSVAFSPDGTALATANDNSSTDLWHVR